MGENKQSIKISIVICTMNRPDDLKICLKSISEQIFLPYEVIIVDASQDHFSEKIFLDFNRKSLFKIQYIKTKPGLTRQRNIGLSKAKGDIIGFIDDDVILEERYLDNITLCFAGDSRIYGATGNITNLPKRKKIDSLYYKIFMLNGNGNIGSITRSGSPNFVNKHVTNTNRFTRILSGCNMFYRRKVFEEFLFDEYFEGYSLAEDAEFSYRISQKYKMMYLSDAKLVHNHSPSQRINLNRYFEMTVLNHNYVFKKLVKQSNFDWLLYWWSNVGVVLTSIYYAFKARSINPIVGLMKGFSKVFNPLILKH